MPMKNIFRGVSLKRIIFLEVAILLPLVLFLWEFKEIQTTNRIIYKDSVEYCDKVTSSKSLFYICNKGMKTFSINPFVYSKRKKNFEREIFYWECLNEKYNKMGEENASRICSEEADKR